MEFNSRQEGRQWVTFLMPTTAGVIQQKKNVAKLALWFLPSVSLDQFGFGLQSLQDFTQDLHPDLLVGDFSTSSSGKHILVLVRSHTCMFVDRFFFFLIFYFPHEKKVSVIVCQATLGLRLTPPSDTNGMAVNQHQLLWHNRNATVASENLVLDIKWIFSIVWSVSTAKCSPLLTSRHREKTAVLFCCQWGDGCDLGGKINKVHSMTAN